MPYFSFKCFEAYSPKTETCIVYYRQTDRQRTISFSGFKAMTQKLHITHHLPRRSQCYLFEGSVKQKDVRLKLYCWEFFFHLKNHGCRWLFSDVIDYSPCLSKTFLLQAMHYVWETQICGSLGGGVIMLLVLGSISCLEGKSVDLPQQRYPELGCQPWHITQRIMTQQ